MAMMGAAARQTVGARRRVLRVGVGLRRVQAGVADHAGYGRQHGRQRRGLVVEHTVPAWVAPTWPAYATV